MRRGRNRRASGWNRLIAGMVVLVFALGGALALGNRLLSDRLQQPGPETMPVITETLASPETEDGEEPRPLIVLDAGHGGKDPGCISGDCYEKDFVLDIAVKAAQMLRDGGFDVVLTREEDSFVALEDRVALAEERGAALFVSVHLNALEDDSVTHGIETYCNASVNTASAALARAVQDHVARETGGKDRGVHTDSEFYVVNHTSMPSCLLEAGFLTSDEERELLVLDAYREKIAAGIAGGIMAFLQNT